MDPGKWKLVGVLSKSQGQEGELLLNVKQDFPDPDNPDNPVFLCLEKEDEGIPFYHKECKRINRKHYAIHFDLVDDPKRASRLIGYKVWLPRSAYPDDPKNVDLLERLQGFRVIDRNEGDIGLIDGGIERSEQPVAFIGEERIPIPLADAFIERIDEKGNILYTDLPEGLTGL